MILDVLDLATFGPIGLVVGGVIGVCAGWVLADLEGYGRPTKCVFAVCAAIYMTVPLTEPIPVATSLGLIARFFRGPPPNTDTPSSVEPPL